ncbi:MAG: PIN domain-containing protein [Acetobacteraceae bacterium]
MVVDSSALIVILRREPEADTFVQTIAEADGSLFSAVSLLETSMVLAGRQGDASAWTEVDALERDDRRWNHRRSESRDETTT